MAADLQVTFRSMASDVRFWVVAPGAGAAAQARAAREVVETVARTCTRFEPTSDLMRANGAGRRRAVVARECFDALRAAYDAYVATDGLFDPRVLRTLAAYGYDTSLPFEQRSIDLPTAEASPRRRTRRRWKPAFDERTLEVAVGPEPVDLGGIGKGLALSWASSLLRDAGEAVLVEAGGDLVALGGGPHGEGWMVGVENPTGAGDPAAVLRLVDRACATSSVRLRSWTAGGEQVHHLIDPRTGRSAESDLVSVTVVGPDPARCEVWSKSLFVVGRSGVRAAADERGLAALWVDARGYVGVSRAMRPYVDWQVSRVA
ncbi:MAG TPA: FAD:protein FMN transferase [Candidatus Nanopelagicales bacterium]|nr:FAD:protein FMN transferase [Candidatus Nanopelagicales bacterium]